MFVWGILWFRFKDIWQLIIRQFKKNNTVYAWGVFLLVVCLYICPWDLILMISYIIFFFFLDLMNICVFQFRKRLCVKKVIMHCTFEINITSAKYKFFLYLKNNWHLPLMMNSFIQSTAAFAFIVTLIRIGLASTKHSSLVFAIHSASFFMQDHCMNKGYI